MNREDEICFVLQGLINGIDFDTGEVIDLSEKVKDSLRVIATVHDCKERCQQYSKISKSDLNQVIDSDKVSGTFKEIINTIKKKRPNHIVIIQNGYFYESLDNDAEFFVKKFGYNSFFHNNSKKTGFPLHAEKVFLELKEMKQSYVLVCQLPKERGQKVQRAITDVYDADERISGVLKTDKNNDDGFEDHKIPNGECEVCGCNISSNLIFCSDCEEDFRQVNSIETQSEALNTISDDLKINNPCIDCGCEIPQARIDNVAGVIRCAKCQSKFEESNPDIVARKIEETLGTREDFKNMSRRQFGINTKTKN